MNFSNDEQDQTLISMYELGYKNVISYANLTEAIINVINSETKYYDSSSVYAEFK